MAPNQGDDHFSRVFGLFSGVTDFFVCGRFSFFVPEWIIHNVEYVSCWRAEGNSLAPDRKWGWNTAFACVKFLRSWSKELTGIAFWIHRFAIHETSQTSPWPDLNEFIFIPETESWKQIGEARVSIYRCTHTRLFLNLTVPKHYVKTISATYLSQGYT